jgi:hypothetical protein
MIWYQYLTNINILKIKYNEYRKWTASHYTIFKALPSFSTGIPPSLAGRGRATFSQRSLLPFH